VCQISLTGSGRFSLISLNQKNYVGVHTAGNLEAWQAGRLGLLGPRQLVPPSSTKPPNPAAGGGKSGKTTAVVGGDSGGGRGAPGPKARSSGGLPGSSASPWLTAAAEERGRNGGHPQIEDPQGLGVRAVGLEQRELGQAGRGVEVEGAGPGGSDGWADEEAGKDGGDAKLPRRPFARKVDLSARFAKSTSCYSNDTYRPCRHVSIEGFKVQLVGSTA
jgi:hypothetical protein